VFAEARARRISGRESPRGDLAPPIRLAIVSGQGLFRDALAIVFGRDEGIEVLGRAGPGPDDYEAAREADVVLVDLAPLAGDGADFLAAARRRFPAARLLALMDTSDEELMVKALKAGAKGCVSTRADVSQLGKAIRSVHEGDMWARRHVLVRCLGEDVPGPAGRAPDGDDAGDGLTPRELEVLRLLASGATNKAIAQALVIREKTVKTHLGNVFRKLHVTGRVQAAVYVLRRGLS
jgi:DNA-binding NarL/FixJ family response regulator